MKSEEICEVLGKHLTVDWLLKGMDGEGRFSGYASVFGVVDSQKDMILPGAFSRSLLSGKTHIKLLWQHDVREPIGVIDALHEDKNGLHVEGRLLLEVARAREAYALLKEGAMNGLSIGYTVKEAAFDAKTGVRLLKEIDLWEVSLVTFPANAEATVRRVKTAMPGSVREFEHFLRGSGFSRSRAKAIALKGFVPELDACEMREWKTAASSGNLIRLADALEKAIGALI